MTYAVAEETSAVERIQPLDIPSPVHHLRHFPRDEALQHEHDNTCRQQNHDHQHQAHQDEQPDVLMIAELARLEQVFPKFRITHIW